LKYYKSHCPVEIKRKAGLVQPIKTGTLESTNYLITKPDPAGYKAEALDTGRYNSHIDFYIKNQKLKV